MIRTFRGKVLLGALFLVAALVVCIAVIPGGINTLVQGQSNAPTVNAAASDPTPLSVASQMQHDIATHSIYGQPGATNIAGVTTPNPDITITITNITNAVTTTDQMKQDCFSIQQTLWSDKTFTLSSVRIDFIGTTHDRYGQPQPNQPLGHCTITSDTAKKIVWSNLNYTLAWNNTLYDDQLIVPFN